MDREKALRVQKEWADHIGQPVEITNSLGMKLALKAGFNFPECVAALRLMADRNNEYSAFRGQEHDHPSWKERLARIDTEHAALWTAMASLVLDIYMHFLPAYQR